ncbi:toll/interleukin-1 receptor (TIR) domain-containing protein [Artemisia annua]|uniref:Toll/interleukin-1 receptor (TIR) domain-containing protein n=1 Tax=Artemisia annua TaxID=35608 RepID=A0A2U1MVH9_ARTAN|nr:toll/interleukin-1 receptor (TIR) domain-containing protein [Artemisia annua]
MPLSKILRFSFDPSSITSLGITLMLMLMGFIYYYFYSKSSSSATKKEKSSSEPKIMVSTSSSSVQKSFKYDVFLSFRGEETRNTFVGHLYKALEQHGIQTYKDNEKIEKGETIDTQLMEAIEDSRFFIIVFSKDYAGSSWCLDELVKIVGCRKASEQTAYPVFYDVEPTEIRKLSGAVKEAFKKHENKKAAMKWREALNEAGNLAGWELKKTANGDESILIQIIVDDIFKKICSSSPSVDRQLVGMEKRIEAVLSSLELDADDVRMIGIWGIGGGGKTTLASAVFDRISNQFDGKAFVENVREVSKSSLYGLKKLQQQILRSVLSKKDITVDSVHEGTNMMKKMMPRIKVLMVLDDVDDIEQLAALAGEPDWFKLGSRVIITTRDKQILLAHEVKFIDVNLLSREEAICLLSKNAFKRDIPIEGYEDLSGKVVKYADGLPLTIKVLGSMLGQNERQWIDTLKRLKEIPLKATMEKLELSYNCLEDDYKEIFLDVACFMKGWDKDAAITALKSCGFFAEAGLRVLEQKSLISISEQKSTYGRLDMHDHIEEMGKNIVRRLHPDNPNTHSRLWIREEIVDVLANGSSKLQKTSMRYKSSINARGLPVVCQDCKNRLCYFINKGPNQSQVFSTGRPLHGTQATKCLRLGSHGEELNYGILINGLANMKELRFLQVYGGWVSKEEVSKWNFDEDSLHLPNALRFLRWEGYHFSSLPKTFQANNLVGLQMFNNDIVQLWKDGAEKPFLKLRFLKLTDSWLLRTLDLSVAPNLETLILERCHYLVEAYFQVTPNLKELRIYSCNRLEKLHMPAESPKLRSLDLSYLWKLRTLHLRFTPNLKELCIYSCNRLEKLHMPAESPKLRSLDLSYSEKLRTLHLGVTPNLETLRVRDCDDLVELQIPAECPKLVNLDLSNCIQVAELPEEIGRLECLKELDITETGIRHLPQSIFRVKGLRIVGSRWLLESCGFTSEIKTSGSKTFCYI